MGVLVLFRVCCVVLSLRSSFCCLLFLLCVHALCLAVYISCLVSCARVLCVYYFVCFVFLLGLGAFYVFCFARVYCLCV